MRKLVVRGSFRSAGAQIGEATRADLPFVREKTVEFLLENSTVGDLDQLRLLASDYVVSTKAIFPEAIEFMVGLAYAGGLTFDDVALIAFSEELRAEFVSGPDRCSTIAVRSQDGWLIGHNEDYEPQYFGKMFALDLRLSGYPRILSLNYPGQFPCLAGSLNQRGVAITNNSLWPDAVPGFSKNVLHFRAALSSHLDEAIEFLIRQPAALTCHYTVAGGEQNDLVGLEVSNAQTAEGTERIFDPGEGPYCHTNHVRFLMLKREDPAVTAKDHSLARLSKLDDLISNGKLPNTPEAMLSLLSTNDGLLHRTPEQSPTSVTLATVVIRPATGELWIRDANPSVIDRDIFLSFGRTSFS
jgi:hypothetical protein